MLSVLTIWKIHVEIIRIFVHVKEDTAIVSFVQAVDKMKSNLGMSTLKLSFAREGKMHLPHRFDHISCKKPIMNLLTTRLVRQTF